jgi:hypothetical protein
MYIKKDKERGLINTNSRFRYKVPKRQSLRNALYRANTGLFPYITILGQFTLALANLATFFWRLNFLGILVSQKICRQFFVDDKFCAIIRKIFTKISIKFDY